MGGLEVESLDMVFKHDHVEYPEDSRVNDFYSSRRRRSIQRETVKELPPGR